MSFASGDLLGFPNPVNEKAARVVAAVVFALSVLVLVASWHWLLPILAYGFVARVLTGPRLSPLGFLASRVVGPRLGAPRFVPGPPKRFAQALGAAMTVIASILALGPGLTTAAEVLVVALVVASGLEAFLGYCVGCRVFALLMRAGLVPAEVCAACADIRAPGRF